MIWNAKQSYLAPSRSSSAGNALKITVLSVVAITVLYFISMQRMFVATSTQRPLSASLQSEVNLRGHVQTTITTRNWKRVLGRRYVWIDVAIDDVPIGRLVAELYMDKVPKTAENFRALVTGDNQHEWSYKNSKCHRILKGFIVQCGAYNSQGGTSIYGKDFEDEQTGLELTHSKRYIRQMANAGPNTNGAQFCFMLGPAPHLNGHHVVFGEVVDGFSVVDHMEEAGVPRDDDKLTHSVVLVNGGEIFD
ncbi:hypothetical protein Ae201684P_000614 [Aphanomyces euteiches]|nr:hypothetical protein Ae201684P_000614 [Aphanomyces euteiches]